MVYGMNTAETLAAAATLLITIVLPLAAIALMVALKLRARRRRRGAYAQLVAEHGGELRASWWRPYALMRLELGGIPVEFEDLALERGRRSSIEVQRVRIAFPLLKRTALVCRHESARHRPRYGAQSIALRDAAFDDQFLVQCDDPSWIARVLDDELRAQHLRTPWVEARLEDSWLTLTSLAPLTAEPSAIMNHVDLALAYRRAILRVLGIK